MHMDPVASLTILNYAVNYYTKTWKSLSRIGGKKPNTFCIIMHFGISCIRSSPSIGAVGRGEEHLQESSLADLVLCRVALLTRCGAVVAPS